VWGVPGSLRKPSGVMGSEVRRRSGRRSATLRGAAREEAKYQKSWGNGGCFLKLIEKLLGGRQQRLACLKRLGVLILRRLS